MTDDRPYFAYGSNLNREHWCAWCLERDLDPDLLRLREPAVLADMELAFRRWSPVWQGGVLDIGERAGSTVPGMLCEVGPAGWQALDRKEGAPAAYRRFALVAVTADGAEVPVLTYRVTRPVPSVEPDPAYLAIVLEGLKACNLPFDHLLRAARLAAP